MPLAEFENFYRKYLKLDSNDFSAFMEAAKSRLPSTLRITPSPHSLRIREKLATFPFLKKVPFLTDVYTFDLKGGHPREFTDFIVAQTDIGNIQRQEVVSLLPHLFLQVEGSHYVLETCAAPGSKTKNILESITDGLLISNEKSAPRVNVLVSESMKKAVPGFIIANMDACHFPNLSIKFDRICCDVPCSSDGTCRKNPAILPKWNIKDSIGLSSVQHRILRRSLDGLKEGGRLVYSTCSMNPIEDEWVVQKAMEGREEFELVDDFEFVQFGDEDETKVRVRRGLSEFDYEGFEYSNEEMRKCFRVLPQDQETGGFFVAVIRRKGVSGLTSPEEKSAAASSASKPAGKSYKPRPTVFVEADEVTKEKISAKYAISAGNLRFVSFNSNFKKIFAISELCHAVLSENPKLKAAYAGISALAASDLEKGSLRAKAAFLAAAGVACDVELTVDEFKLFLADRDVPLEALSSRPSGLFTCSVDGLKFCGFAGGRNAFLYIDENHRKAYRQLY